MLKLRAMARGDTALIRIPLTNLMMTFLRIELESILTRILQDRPEKGKETILQK